MIVCGATTGILILNFLPDERKKPVQETQFSFNRGRGSAGLVASPRELQNGHDLLPSLL